MSALRSPLPAPPSSAPRAKALGRLPIDKPLRGGNVRHLGTARAAARQAWAGHLSERLGAAGVSNREIAQAFENSSERFGAEVRAGAAPVTPGEVVQLLPFPTGALALLDVVRARVLGELVSLELPESRQARLRLVLTHIDAIAVLLGT